ncbi:hypothetical protein BJ508DRAFT_322641 [Ascobolus immersus RN42]|uniref:Uncharacterized protein n=1 Tax=Ascobolus immersus RN42 TaxID=1160509 RepID=A0A3N4IHJ2_ASCIM|nr:hypothetical protein BJ508DRAFT_322641 [Ascobolus immersus RN42]
MNEDTKVYLGICLQVEGLISQNKYEEAIHICDRLLDRPTIPLFFEAWMLLLKGSALIHNGSVGYCASKVALRRSLELWKVYISPEQSNSVVEWIESQLAALEPEIEKIISTGAVTLSRSETADEDFSEVEAEDSLEVETENAAPSGGFEELGEPSEDTTMEDAIPQEGSNSQVKVLRNIDFNIDKGNEKKKPAKKGQWE